MYGKHLFQEKENIIKTITYKDDFRDFLYVEEGSVDPGNTAVVTTDNTTSTLRYGRSFTGKWTCLIDAVYCRDTEKDIITDIEKAEYSIFARRGIGTNPIILRICPSVYPQRPMN